MKIDYHNLKSLIYKTSDCLGSMLDNLNIDNLDEVVIEWNSYKLQNAVREIGEELSRLNRGRE